MKRLPYREIAEKAGVSVSTVYRAISEPDPSSQSCRKVRDAISALGGNPMDYGLSDRSAPGSSVPFVMVDNEGGCFQCRKISCVAGLQTDCHAQWSILIQICNR